MDNKYEVNRFIEEILGFSKPWEVTKIDKNEEEEKLTIYLNYPKGTKFKCPKCGKKCIVNHSRIREIRHMDLFQYKAYIKVKVPRIKCCGEKKMDITPVC